MEIFITINTFYKATKFQILDADGDSLISTNGLQDTMGPPINETIN